MNNLGLSKREIALIPLATLIWVIVWQYFNLDISPFDPKNYVPAAVAGLVIGFFSGLQPLRAFRICVYGFSVLWIFFALGGILFPYESGLGAILVFSPLIVTLLCGLFGIAGALLRRIVLRQEIERIHLKHWQWTFLIGGLVILVNILFFFDVIGQLHLYEYYGWTYFAPFLLSAFMGLFALGLFTGAFYDLPYQRLLLVLMRIIGICLLSFLGVYAIILVLDQRFTWVAFLVPVFSLASTGLLLLGVHLGYRLKP